MPSFRNGGEHGGSSSQLTRSASYNCVPELNPGGESNSIRKTLSEVNLTHSADQQIASQHTGDFVSGKEVLRQSSLRSKRKKDPVFTLGVDDETGINSTSEKGARTPERPRKTKAVTGALASLTRRTWKSSRSPSPSQTNRDDKQRPGRANGRTSFESDPPAQDGTPAEPTKEGGKYPGTDLARAPSVLTKRNRRPLSTVVAKEQSDASPVITRTPSLQSLRRKSSLERLAASVGLSKTDIPPIPQNPPSNATKIKPEQPRKKDELWNVFRGLDADFQKYQSKSSSLKVNVIRSSLLPCLARYAKHPSNSCLRPEDLDRRVNILNKWWTGLLETLSGRTSHSITGVDRPVYLEAITAIMMRPEWRIPTSPNSPGATPTQKSDLTQKSTTSLESTGSDFLVESIHHNIRNILSQNLLSQLAYCVDKMSTRHTPASLVSFAGKSCAYGFFFCRDVCDLLVRLWNAGPDLLKRVTSQFKTEGNPATRSAISEYIVSCFPAAVRSLSFTSYAALVRNLRRNVSIPLAASNINWFGPWVSRWCGRDTDLFFVFVKHFHILAAEFLPAGTDLSRRVYVPGLVLVHAQMLAVLESTLSKQSNPQMPENAHGATSTTFEDFIDGAEATATGFPLGATNSLRIMSENRLILILKNILLDNSVPADTKQFFLEAFCSILKLAARKTSLFDHGPCFVLCDFVEELVPIIPPYCQSTGQPDILDWDFWLEVCKQMMKSKHIVTEVRAFAFIFAAWEAINRDERRKEQLCSGLLLQHQVFHHYFSHWSPMVRAYFHRLLCWRLARLSDQPSSLDRRIYSDLSSRLGDVWNYFLAYQSRAEKQLTAPLSSVPCSPAPGRRIIIIRDDAAPPPTSLFVFLDDVPSATDRVNASSEQNPIQDSNTTATTTPAQSQPPAKKRWKMLRSIFGNSSNPKPGEVTPPGSSCDESDDLGGSKSEFNASSADPRHAESNGSDLEETSKPYRAYTFRFCLEWVDRQRCLPRNRRLFPPSLPTQTQIYLQATRKTAVGGSDSGSGSGSGPGSVSNSVSETSSVLESDTDCMEESSNAMALNASPWAVSACPIAKEISSSSNPQHTGNCCFVASKYAGRALAEWGLVVSECDCFFQRRKDEGVPCDNLVEIPMLSVDSFRK
ncbi:uncharacterized protein CIMG_11159 [Coccidioides immitis RS]|uniref:DUF1765-domain-containing protein n=3 Tax=Coccidioides immitis TaxID=5501 RepID=J3KBS4_COCIM|nr:uncharacterized protein CIMG_11159 [Coccidioides immitis RS]EAS32601.3 hypothetical protein CIMG_11159 [Coccidioides immitis RS]KMP07843.1 hypothetical protein CIRG_07524 [Coccidioides immitis RMSCC 2394]KMU71696.1 hypothetical protein CISG_00006 [Coccidioides immitis RMSCC 3703]TPX19641.1 hypothetical protein DIZ76_017433 [Coccidioides immitis]